MADGAFGAREIQLDINGVITARTLRDAALGYVVKIKKIIVTGTTGAGDGSLVLRSESASGPIIWKLGPTINATQYNIDAPFNRPSPTVKGLYLDAIGTAWAAGSTMIIHTA